MTILGIMAINVILYFMITEISKNHAIESENALLRQRNFYQIKYAENIKNLDEEIQHIQHDLNHSLNVIDILLSEKKYEQAISYLHTYIKENNLKESYIKTNNDFVNAIINSKMTLAKSRGIKIFCTTTSDFGEIKDIDLCNLLGNLLDNSIEACQAVKKKEKSIELKIFSNGNGVIIDIKNSIESSVLAHNPELKTNKKDSNSHGYGIINIKNIVKKYNGKIDYYEENDYFCYLIYLYSNTDLLN